MYTLKNDSLSVSILDPIADQARFGTRYATGGYIFQVDDAKHGPVTTGPTWPNSFNWFDGQGLPDTFHNQPLRLGDPSNNIGLIIGIGLCDLQANKVSEFCRWDIQQSATEMVFNTTHVLGDIEVKLERTIALRGRTVRSASYLRNTGKQHIQIRWYPHPFLPHPKTDELIRLNIPVTMPENAGYKLADNGYITRKGWPWTEGHYQVLAHDAHTNLVVFQKHPTLGLIGATCSFIPSFFPIWGNQNTFSWEPFIERTVAAGHEYHWWIDYEF
jgi:hypothetical protein